ncbi:hypothetical protein H5P28_17475 [Ruficoccus amylovorans]|uniref:Uncharacterized protein n=1 Tax=Ruficoccus amylovorans TaxID=1804625 RepID=A0A842HLR5_9BACT|nr:DUF6653 family protein [Ruficoccus amylovorans]MBC2596061.1 hypothetical protein [Ruficoccus amylovorans]
MKTDFARACEKLMGMDERTWERHANPWSVYSRFTVMPLLTLAIVSRVWIGGWAWLATAVVLLWIWLNPRLFPACSRKSGWAVEVTRGERLYLARQRQPIPPHHAQAARLLQMLSVAGLPIWVYGLYTLNTWALVLGNVCIIAFKAWFADRMVWLHRDMQMGG